MSATILAIKSEEPEDIVDFLRRFATLLSGGNGRKLLDAAGQIETLTRRALTAEESCRRLRDANAQHIASRDVAEITVDKLTEEVTALNAQLVESARQAKFDRNHLAAEARRLSAMAEDAQARLAERNAELSGLRAALSALGERLAVVPVQPLQVARAQFDSLAEGFARNGDLISQTMCEIGACALDDAMAASNAAKDSIESSEAART